MADSVSKRRKARKKWVLRMADTARNSDLRCAACNDPAPLAPIGSHYSQPRLLEQIWRCARCGNQWSTSIKLPS